MKSILILGGTGFIGFHLAKNCLKKNWLVTSISSKKPLKIRKLKRVKYIICDITNFQKLKKKIKTKKFDYVVNLSGYIDHKNKVKTYNSHFIGVKNLFNVLKKKKLRSFFKLEVRMNMVLRSHLKERTIFVNQKRFMEKQSF